MKKIIDIINEDFKIPNKKRRMISKTKVTSNKELCAVINDIIQQELENNAKGITLDLNHIDVSELTTINCLLYNQRNTAINNRFDIIKEIDISEWDVSNVESFAQAFTNIKKVEKIYLPEISSKKLENIQNMFLGCYNLREIINIEKLCVNPILYASRAFANCHTLERIDVSSWNMTKCQSTNAMFINCLNLKSIGDITNWNPTNVQYISSMFKGCKKLEYIGDLEKWHISPTSIYSMFAECQQLKFIGDISNWDLSNITDMCDLFYGCANLSDVGDLTKWNITNANFTTSAPKESVFNGATNLPFKVKGRKIIKVR